MKMSLEAVLFLTCVAAVTTITSFAFPSCPLNSPNLILIVSLKAVGSLGFTFYQRDYSIDWTSWL